MKKFLFAVMTASALVACENQDVAEVQPPVGEKAVTLSIQQTGPKTRGVTDQKGTDEYAVIGSGEIFFIDNSGNNVYKRELTVTEINNLANTSTTAGGKQIVITGVPNTATTLFFVANVMTTAHTTGFPAIEGTSAADARLRIDKLQADPIHVPMSGQSTSFVSTGTNLYTASVTITPLVARVEVGQITCKNQNDPAGAISADITGYKLAGVFVNNVRPYVLLAGTPYLTGAPIDIKTQTGWNSGWANYFNATNEVFPYFSGGNPSAPSDWVLNSMVTYCSPTTTALSFYPNVTNGATSTDPALTPKQAWAFQVCPSNTVVTRSQAYDLPHLILKLTDVTYKEDPFGLPVKYVTITNYKTANDVAVTKFERGNVYRIINLTFTHNETTNQPYAENITVTATVSVAPWVINDIVPDWN